MSGLFKLWRRTIISVAELQLIECGVEAYEEDIDPASRGSEGRSTPSSYRFKTVPDPITPHP